MKSAVYVLAAAFAFGLPACHCPVQQSLVAVREQQVRSDDVSLPLDQASRDKLMTYLGAGGNRDSMGEDAPSPDVASKYGPLLDLLKASDLTPASLASAPFRPWFHDAATEEVIDARNLRPFVPGTAHAVSDGSYWWVFKSANGKLTGLVISKAGPLRIREIAS
jgi:hypothetical protein